MVRMASIHISIRKHDSRKSYGEGLWAPSASGAMRPAPPAESRHQNSSKMEGRVDFVYICIYLYIYIYVVPPPWVYLPLEFIGMCSYFFLSFWDIYIYTHTVDGGKIRFSHHRSKTPNGMIRFLNANANQGYGFNHGFKVVQDFVHPQYLYIYIYIYIYIYVGVSFLRDPNT